MSRLPPEVLSAIVKVSGKWAFSMATTPHPAEKPRVYIPPQPSEVSGELKTHFEWAFSYLESYIQQYLSKPE